MCIDVNAYSAPPWRELTLKADLITVSLSERHMLIVTHLPSWQRKQRIELPTHEELVRKIHKKTLARPAGGTLCRSETGGSRVPKCALQDSSAHPKKRSEAA